MMNRVLLMTLLVCPLWPTAARAQTGIPWTDAVDGLRNTAGDWAHDYGVTGGASTVAGAVDAHGALGDVDRAVESALDDPGGSPPPVPASCLTRDGCEECFERPYEQLGRSRVLLARARAVFDATHRFATAATALGDNLAPSTREAALVWQFQKPKIAASLTQFDATYDRKIADMLAVLRRTLEEIGQCEARFYNNADWYARFGFIYFEFMQSRYRRV